MRILENIDLLLDQPLWVLLNLEDLLGIWHRRVWLLEGREVAHIHRALLPVILIFFADLRPHFLPCISEPTVVHYLRRRFFNLIFYDFTE